MSQDMEELNSLFIQAQAGDLDSYGVIIQRFQDMAVGYAYSILGDFHLAEDAAQEAFIEAFPNLPKVYGTAAFPRWLRKLVFKHCDRLTRRRKTKTVPLEAAIYLPSQGKGPAAVAEEQEMKHSVLAAIQSLPDRERTVTTLFYINGYSQKDIAEFLDVPVTTVKKRLHDSRKRMKGRLFRMVQDDLQEKRPSKDDRFANRVKAGQLTDRATLRRFLKQPKLEISADQANAILEKHQLGRVQSLKLLQENLEGDLFMNAVFEITSARGEPLILKVQCRHVAGFSLEVEHYVINLLRGSTDLPVADLCLLGLEEDILTYPYLLLNKLPGAEGCRDFFEKTDHAGRMQLSEKLGYIVGVIHSQRVPEPELLNNETRLNQWRRIVKEALLGDEALTAEITAFSKEFYPQFNELMASVKIPVLNEEPVLLWFYPGFYNLRVKRSEGRIHITGVSDFQAASYGNRIFDLAHIEADFRLRRPPEIYSDPRYVEQFYKGYEEAGQTRGVFEDTYEILRKIILKARNVRFWWDCGGILHPTNSDSLKDILTGLERLSRR